MPPRRCPRWPRRWLRQRPEPHCSSWPARRLREGSPVCRRGRTGPRSARPCRPSPWRRSSASGPADRWASLSSRPCLPCCRKSYEQQGPFAPRALPRFHATTSPSVTLSSSADFPVLPVIRLTQLPPFRVGTRRASPVAQCVLALVPSLTTPPERPVASIGLRRAVLPSPSRLRARPPRLLTFEATSRSLTLRPG